MRGISTSSMTTAGGVGMSGVVAGAFATKDTVRARRQEKLFSKTGGLTGLSRTKANKKITETWSGAVGGTATGALGGMVVGQVTCYFLS